MSEPGYYCLGMSAMLVLLSFVAPPLLAARKGYAWYLWTVACGLPGLFVLAFLPWANSSKVDESLNRSRRQAGNTVGTVLSAIGLLSVPYLLLPAFPFIRDLAATESPWVSQFLEYLFLGSPGLLVELLGLVLASVWWRPHPWTSLLTLVALGLRLASGVGGWFLFAWLSEYRAWALLPGIAMVRSTIGAAGTMLLLVAIFGGRSQREVSQQPNAEVVPNRPASRRWHVSNRGPYGTLRGVST